MTLKKTSLQIAFIFGMSIAALIGAFVGIFLAFSLTGLLHVDEFLQITSDSNKAVDAKIVEMIEEESATIAVVERVAPAVVSIVIKKERGNLYSYNDSYFDFFSPYEEIPVYTETEAQELVEIGGGTGFFVTEDGYVVTNRHVVSDEDAVYLVVTSDGKELPARIVALDPYYDIAVLDVEGDGYPIVSFGDSDFAKVGQTVIAIGNSLSEFENTVTKGVISGTNRSIVAYDDDGSNAVIRNALQTDAAINPGNSGGPLINLLSEVIAVNTALSYDGDSIGFAIPINDVKRIVSDIQTYGEVRRPWLGVWYVMLTPEYAIEMDLASEYGALVQSSQEEEAVIAGSPAAEAGLQEGDVILSINGESLSGRETLGEVIYQYFPGDEVVLMILREGETKEILVLLKAYQSEE
ncbi:MAG: Protease Do [Candidatus Uhrbacteria bacterium GW2011_GWE2_40_58]|nr:MAG: Protease Do [Candidatus Uhrbacteria bacterium GW2011_GWF2_40_263]KKR67853.1 MAG: Protease Do [Candidatus Uhrbacteria bacterium GW2011_GWE2_40_58]OGL96825.1 MAG: hypothetical protein A2332_02200 [Candidatus Uhrbacteria bacterium RIFOXYB2_FULL_41_18]HBK34917.1 hypothetical protein [Candidatus Uhrbacteria bacterium]HCB55527.1 hypothetical protein [Candidatus Uhrbacteria bacterium]